MIRQLKENYIYIIIYLISSLVFFFLFKSILEYIDLFYNYVLYLLTFLYVIMGFFYIINKRVCIVIYFLMLLSILLLRKETKGINTELYFKKWIPLLFENKTVFINIVGNIIIFIPLGIILYNKIHISILIVIFLESLQYLLSRGIFDIMDIILNIVGIFIGMIGVLLCQKIKKKKNLSVMKKSVKQIKK